MSRDYLFSFLRNDEQFLSYYNGKEWCADLADEIFADFEFAAAALDESLYLKTEGLSYQEPYKSPVRVYVDESFLRKFFTARGDAKFLEGVEWGEVGIKLRLIARESLRKEQGIPTPLHKAIVELLMNKERALSRGQIATMLGIPELKLDPLSLPPGRIVAYAPSKRFMSKDSAFYVLREWVAENKYDKKKIARERVVTPLERKLIDVTVGDVEDALSALPSTLLGCVSSVEVAAWIAKRMPEEPSEPYYQGIIRNRVEKILESLGFVDMGKHFFVRDALLTEVSRSESLPKRRRHIINKVLNEARGAFGDSNSCHAVEATCRACI